MNVVVGSTPCWAICPLAIVIFFCYAAISRVRQVSTVEMFKQSKYAKIQSTDLQVDKWCKQQPRLSDISLRLEEEEDRNEIGLAHMKYEIEVLRRSTLSSNIQISK